MAQRRLLPAVQDILNESAEDRIQFAQQDSWIAYPLATKLLGMMENLNNAPKSTRVKSLLVVGVPNSGKTTIKNRFLLNHPAVESSDGSRTLFRILHIEAPPKADPRAFCMAILDACGAVYSDASFAVLAKQVMAVLKETEVRLLVIDEIHNFLTGRRDMKESLLNTIRSICNVLKISVIAFGIPSALQVFAAEPQLSSRFKREIIPRWDDQKNLETLKKMLASLEMTLPLKKASNLGKKELRDKLIMMSEGILGEMIDILEDATIEAITTGDEQITPALLDAIGWISPSEREKLKADA